MTSAGILHYDSEHNVSMLHPDMVVLTLKTQLTETPCFINRLTDSGDPDSSAALNLVVRSSLLHNLSGLAFMSFISPVNSR